MNIHSAIHTLGVMDANTVTPVSEASLSYRTPTSAHGAGGKRDAILEAALVLFAERGFHGTPVPLVAKQAGVGAGTIYRYFESKEALVNALYQRCKGQMGERILAEFQPDASPREQLRLYWTRMCAFVREHPQAFKFMTEHDGDSGAAGGDQESAFSLAIGRRTMKAAPHPGSDVTEMSPP